VSLEIVWYDIDLGDGNAQYVDAAEEDIDRTL
jgi:hypothetical protein